MWRRYPFESMWSEMENMRQELEHMFQMASPGVPPTRGVTDRMLPALRGEFRVCVWEHDDEGMVVADLPDVEKEHVSLQLINPRTLKISCERKGEKEGNLKATMSVNGHMDLTSQNSPQNRR